MRTPRSIPALLLALAAGCNPVDTTHDPSDLPDWSDYFEGGTVDTNTSTTTDTDQPVADDTQLNLSVPATVNWPWKMRRWDSVTGTVYPDEACDIDMTTAVAGNATEEDCILEQDEGDLFFSGMDVFLHVPPDTCDYLIVAMYQYQAFAVGTGPPAVEYTIHADGSITDLDTNGDGYLDSFNGEPQCLYDYGIPDCCVGNYIQTVHNESNGETIVSSESWGGEDDEGDCFDGGAFLYKKASFYTDGVPRIPYWFLDRGGLDEDFQFFAPATEEHPLGDAYGTSMPLASYHDLADSNGVLPVSLDGANLPVGVANSDFGLSLVQPEYEFICTDNALEKLGVIHLSVREWNTEAEFKIDGDPDAGIGELEPTPPFQPLDDLIDWAEWPADIYLGASD